MIDLKTLADGWDFEELEAMAKDSDIKKQDKIDFLNEQKNRTQFECDSFMDRWDDFFVLSECQKIRVQRIIDSIN